MNLGELRALVRKQTLASADAIDNATLNGFINDGMRAVASRFKWPFLETTATITTVADQAAYALPSDYRRTSVVIPVVSGRRLVRTTLEEETLRRNPIPTAQIADRFYIYGDEILLAPIPDISDVDYTHYYTKGITTLSSDADEPEFLSDFHIAPARYAMARVWEYEEDFPKVRDLDSRFDLDVEIMARYYLGRTEDTPAIFGESRRVSPADNMPFLSGL
jgi:hypothetical protein